MAIRVTVGIPESLHKRIAARAHETGKSVQELIVDALEANFPEMRKGKRVTGPLIRKTGMHGPRFLSGENLNDLMFG